MLDRSRAARRILGVLVGGLVLTPIVSAPRPVAAATAGTIVPVVSNAQTAKPEAITTGPDGNLWFASSANAGSIGRVTTGGTVTSFTDAKINKPTSITAGPDGALWFLNSGDKTVGRITTTGVVTSISSPLITSVEGIASGADGNLWVVSASNNTIARVTTAGVVTAFTTVNATVGTLADITAGPDGNLWFVASASVDRITPAGAITTFPNPDGPDAEKIAPGADGSLWVTDDDGFIQKVTTAGVITKHTTAGMVSSFAATPGADGNVWFTDLFGKAFGRVTPAGVVTLFPADASYKGLDTVTAGPDGSVWWADFGTGTIGYIGTGATSYGAGLPGSYVPLPPTRILDTRNGLGAPAGPLAGGETIDLQATNVGGIPGVGVSAVVLNVTAVNPSESSFVTAFPTGQPRPLASNLNFAAHQVVPNLVTVKVGTGGKVSLYNLTGRTDLLADVAGYVQGAGAIPGTPAGSSFNALSPARILDSRSALGTGSTPGPQSTTLLQVTGNGGVPAGATAVVLNVTAIAPTESGFVTAYPSDQPRPVVSNLNFVPGQVVPNLAIVKLSPTGSIALFNFSGKTDLAADVAGYFTSSDGALVTPLAPVRVLDTRSSGGPVGSGGTLNVPIAGKNGVPVGAKAVIVNLTAVSPTDTGFVTAYPQGTTRPIASNLNFVPGQVVPNLAIVKLGTGGGITIYNFAGKTNVLADVAGYLT